MESSYILAWAIYLCAVLAAQLLVWRLTRVLPLRDAGWVFQLCVLALLITPARLAPDSPHWVPAFMAALMESIESGIDAGLARMWPVFVLMLIFVLASMAWRVRGLRRRRNIDTSGSAPKAS